MQGVYSIAEVIDDSNKRPDKTVFCVKKPRLFDMDGTTNVWNEKELKSLYAVEDTVRRNGATCCEWGELASLLNSRIDKKYTQEQKFKQIVDFTIKSLEDWRKGAMIDINCLAMDLRSLRDAANKK